ncbi:MAG TPA: alanine racemase [Thermoanaerobaculia bacterium]|nr:alanine racemase [Thermoanaerobaculia bacterium]
MRADGPRGARSRPARAIVDLDAIASNYRLLRDRVAPRPVYAVLKADAYGHGAEAVARRLAREGADRFAVAQTEEGARLRRAGVAGEVLVLSHAEAPDLPRLRAYGLTPALYDLGQIRDLADASRELSPPIAAHLELDTGMGRAGIRLEELGAAVEALRAARGLRVVVTFANLSSSDDASSEATARQVERLREGASRLSSAGIGPGLVHAANSAAILTHRDAWLDAVRPGLALYGIVPRPDAAEPGLRPAMSVETRVLAVRRLPAGTPIGYGGRFVTARETTVAVLPIGYADGYRRSFSGAASVLLRGRSAPVVGAVSMDVTLVDATGLSVERGDRAVCLGSQEGAAVTAWDLALAARTIPYEILCGFGPRVARRYLPDAGPSASGDH